MSYPLSFISFSFLLLLFRLYLFYLKRLHFFTILKSTYNLCITLNASLYPHLLSLALYRLVHG